jgi:hypothetical protein
MGGFGSLVLADCAIVLLAPMAAQNRRSLQEQARLLLERRGAPAPAGRHGAGQAVADAPAACPRPQGRSAHAGLQPFTPSVMEAFRSLSRGGRGLASRPSESRGHAEGLWLCARHWAYYR